jgi:hypothetical protein
LASYFTVAWQYSQREQLVFRYGLNSLLIFVDITISASHDFL